MVVFHYKRTVHTIIPGEKTENHTIVAACQPREIIDNVEQTLGTIIDCAAQAEALDAELVCFPECYLQGYVVDEEKTAERAIDLSSPEFSAVLKRLSHVNPLMVFGVIEIENDRLYNTAVIVEHGKLLGSYRKVKLLPGESVFDAGTDFPVFDLNGLRFGINICNDLNFPECSKAISDQNADLIVCPCNNMLRCETAEKWKSKHNEIRARRSAETGLWILSSDVTGRRDHRVSYGPTALINPTGTVVAQVPLLETGLLAQEISF